MKRTIRRYPGLSMPALSVAVAALAAGCETAPPGGGFTNPNAGSVTAQDKPSARTDMPVPDAGAGRDEPIAEAASSSPGGTGSTGGTGSPGGGQPGSDTGKVRQTSPEAATPPPANPPAKQNSGNAQGGTRPDDKVNSGTPRSPQ